MFIGISMHFIVVQIFSATLISITCIWKDFIKTNNFLQSYLNKRSFQVQANNDINTHDIVCNNPKQPICKFNATQENTKQGI